jgi:putative DNA primase/helicase
MEWDSNPYAAACPDVTVNLHTGETALSNMLNRVRNYCSVNPAPKGTPHPIFSAFLNQITGGDLEYQQYIQRLLGYCLTGDVKEEIMLFAYGSGGNGKGVLFKTVLAIMGGYAISTNREILSSTGISRVNPEYYRADWPGKRLILAVETKRNAVFNEAEINEGSGNGARLTGRYLAGGSFIFGQLTNSASSATMPPIRRPRQPCPQSRNSRAEPGTPIACHAFYLQTATAR